MSEEYTESRWTNGYVSIHWENEDEVVITGTYGKSSNYDWW